MLRERLSPPAANQPGRRDSPTLSRLSWVMSRPGWPRRTLQRLSIVLTARHRGCRGCGGANLPAGDIAPGTAAAAGPGGPQSSPAMNSGRESSQPAADRREGRRQPERVRRRLRSGEPVRRGCVVSVPEQVAQESWHDPAFQARMRPRPAQIDAMPEDSVRDADDGHAQRGRSAPHNDCGRGRGQVCH